MVIIGAQLFPIWTWSRMFEKSLSNARVGPNLHLKIDIYI